MTDESSSFELGRRKALATLGGLAVAGAGVGTLSSTGAASSADISASNVTVENDRGDLSKLTIDPSFSVSWSGLDDAVGKVFFLIEARVDGGEWAPLFRATPWLDAGDIDTSGTYEVAVPLSDALNQDDRWSDGNSASPLVVADEQGKPDYSSIDFSTIGGVTLDTFLDGTSMGSAGNYPAANDGGFQNNYPDIYSGYYGAAADTSAFDVDEDGATGTTVTDLRYTFELQRPNLSQLEWRVDMSNYDGTDSWSDLTVEEQKTFAASEIEGLEESDIDEGNSAIVMSGEDGYAGFEHPDGIPYSELQANSAHPGISVVETSFEVTVKNIVGTATSDGSSNTGGS